MKFTKPKATDVFTVTSTPAWPSIVFETDGKGAHTWEWTITWGAFKKSGKASTTGNNWDAQTVVTNFGGTLTVKAQAGKDSVSISVKIKGTNPSGAEVNQYLATCTNSAGFDKIIEHESKYKHFNAGGEPIKSFDNGYGMCQLTTPAPSFEQVWNWKLNIDGGLSLFGQKRTSAIAYLSQSQSTYTADQLKYEAVCRWNGGAYHTWDAKAGAWVRPSNILCDKATGNIGWDMDDAENKGKTEAALRTRDSGSYSAPPAADAHWKYLGVCYADRILG
ncbi:MAG: hypothetical protein ACOYMG_08905 [Candidatus Methylumidiphilus sp.]